MTQSLIRTAPDTAPWLDVNGRALSGTHGQIASILRSRLGHNHGALLAQPLVAADGSVAWSTALAGPVLRAADMPEADRAALMRRAERMVSDVRNLAAQMRSEGASGPVVAAVLEQALQWPPGDWLFSVDGKPVFVMWGHGTPGQATAAAVVAAGPNVSPLTSPSTASLTSPVGPPLAPQQDASPAGPSALASPAVAASAAAPAAFATAASALPPPAAAQPASPAGPDRRRWLLAAAALLLLGGLLFGLSRCSSGGGPGLADSIAQAEDSNRALEAQLARQRAARLQCLPDPVAQAAPPQPEPPVAAPPDLPASEPPAPAPVERVAEGPAPRPLARATPPAPAPAPVPEPRQMPQLPDLKPDASPASTPRASPAAPQRQACKPPRPGDEPEVILIVDASGSMREPMGGMSRLEAAKRAADQMIRGLPAAVDVGLVDFSACNQVRRDKFYSAPERGALIGEINGLSPKQGTPLAQAIERAGRVASDSAEAVLVVVSDGGDSCGGDPCGAARRLKAQRPKVTINVIDLSNSGGDRAALQCVASAGGGRVLRPGDPLDLQQKMKEAAGSAACTS